MTQKERKYDNFKKKIFLTEFKRKMKTIIQIMGNRLNATDTFHKDFYFYLYKNKSMKMGMNFLKSFFNKLYL